jgi:anti-sigma B factor antagonist
MAQTAATVNVTINLHVELHPGAPPVAEISGEIDIESAPMLRDTLLLAIRRYGPAICVDLHGVRFLDCSGINVLLATARRASLEGGWMRVTRPSAQAWRVITLLGLRDALTKDTSDRSGTSARPTATARSAPACANSRLSASTAGPQAHRTKEAQP